MQLPMFKYSLNAPSLHKFLKIERYEMASPFITNGLVSEIQNPPFLPSGNLVCDKSHILFVLDGEFGEINSGSEHEMQSAII